MNFNIYTKEYKVLNLGNNMGQMMKTIIKFKKEIPFFIGIISASIFYFLDYKKLPILFGFLLIVIIPYSRDILNYFIQEHENNIKLNNIKIYLNNLNQFYLIFLNSKKIQQDFNYYVNLINDANYEPNYINIGNQILLENSNDNVYIIYLCFIIDSGFSSIETKTEARRLLNSILENNKINNIESIGESSIKNLLIYYSNYQNKINIFTSKEINVKNEFELFTKNYATSIYTNYILNLDIKKSKEYRRTIIKLLDGGKIHSKNIIDDFKLNKNINAFLLFSNILENDNIRIKNKLGEYNQIEFKPSTGDYKYKTRLIFSNKNVNPEDFLEDNYAKFYDKKEKISGFVGLFPIEINKLHFFPKDKDNIITKENYLRRNYDKLIEYKLLAKAVNLENLIIMNNVPIKDLLSNLPINIFIPNEKEIIKDFIIDSYSVLKKRFKIKDIYDWAEINSNDLMEEFVKLDIDKLSTNDNWTKISEKIIDEVMKIKDSIKN